jgi:peptidoglycan/LPS O-acetylase OafA/YrhL
MRYRREIDGLRALAVLPVIFFHAGFRAFAGGFVGVDVFFVVSGYLITSLIVSEKSTGTFTLANFYERRIRRILPALFVVMLACLPFAWAWMLPSEVKDFSKSLIAVAVFLSNILFWREGGYFETPGAVKPLFHTWSLAVEEQYYLLFPVFLLLIWPIGKRWIRFIFAILALASLLAAEWMSQHHPQGAFYLLPTRGWELLIGASVALYFIGAKPSILAARETASLTNDIAATLGLLLIAYAVVAFDRNVPFPSFYALVPTVGAALVILFANQRSLVGKLLSTRILVSVGLISYSAYLWHQPLFAFARIRNQGVLSTPLVSILCLAAVACAYFSWKFVEKPFRNRALIGRTTVFLSAAAMSLLFVLIGFVGLTTNGLAYRYSEDDRYLAAFDSFQAGRYVEKLFDGLELKPFDASGRRKIVVVGDSFAQDLVNAMNEGGLMTQLQVSTHWIPTQCGNLFLEANPISYVDQARRGICSNTGWYDSQALRKIMAEADAIWIASKWTPWEAELLPASIRNLTSTFHAPVLIFGPKNFGRFTIPELLHLSIAQRLAYKSAMVDSHIQLNDLMKSTLPANNFLDVSKLLCGPSNTCPLFTTDAKLISFDGGHLTKDGAAYFGQRLAPLLSAQGLIPAH